MLEYIRFMNKKKGGRCCVIPARGFVMEFMQGLQQELLQMGMRTEVEETILEFSSTDIVKLNGEIGLMVENDRIMLESSPGKAARFACSK